MPRSPSTSTGSTDRRSEVAGSTAQTDASSYLDVRYASKRRPFTEYPLRLSRYLSETYLRDPSFRKMLELGCGRGEVLHGFAECGFEVLGLDGSLYSERRIQEPIVIADIEGRPIPFASNSVDVIFHKSVIEHIQNTSFFLSEIHRVLRPGGLMIAMTPDWKAQFRHFYDDYTHVRPFTLEGISDAVRAHRFLIRDGRRFRQLPFLWHRPYLHIFSNLLAMLPDKLKSYKIVKFSKEWMLLMVAEKPA